MKVGIIADLHGRSDWKQTIDSKPEVSHWVFLGDYVDSFIHDRVEIIANLTKIINFKKKNRDNVTLLLGNHDIHYLMNDDWYKCSGYDPIAAVELERLFVENKKLFILGIEIANYYITHAGITQSWFDRFKKIMKKWDIDISKENVISYMNTIFHHGPKEAFDVIMQVGKARGGYEVNGGPIWADEKELKKDSAFGINQIVGHTPQRTGIPFQYETTTKELLIFADIGETFKLNPVLLEYDEAIIS